MQKFTKLACLAAASILLTVYVGAAGLILSRLLGYRVVSVASGSMSPAINRGDALIVKQTKNLNLQPGQLLSYKMNGQKGEVITHRIFASQPNSLQTKGDANTRPDHPIAQSQIYGRPVARMINFGTILDLLKSTIGLALCVYLPTLAIIVYEVRQLIVGATRTHYLIDYSYAKKRQKA